MEKSMRRVLKGSIISTIVIFMIGCSSASLTDMILDKKSILTANDWYEIESCEDDYNIYNFTDTLYTKTLYTNDTLTEVDHTETATITEYMGAGFNITRDGTEYNCAVSNEIPESEWILVQCTTQNGDNTINSIFYSAWKTKELALSNRDSKCE